MGVSRSSARGARTLQRCLWGLHMHRSGVVCSAARSGARGAEGHLAGAAARQHAHRHCRRPATGLQHSNTPGDLEPQPLSYAGAARRAGGGFGRRKAVMSAAALPSLALPLPPSAAACTSLPQAVAAAASQLLATYLMTAVLLRPPRGPSSSLPSPSLSPTVSAKLQAALAVAPHGLGQVTGRLLLPAWTWVLAGYVVMVGPSVPGLLLGAGLSLAGERQDRALLGPRSVCRLAVQLADSRCFSDSGASNARALNPRHVRIACHLTPALALLLHTLLGTRHTLVRRRRRLPGGRRHWPARAPPAGAAGPSSTGGASYCCLHRRRHRRPRRRARTAAAGGRRRQRQRRAQRCCRPRGRAGVGQRCGSAVGRGRRRRGHGSRCAVAAGRVQLRPRLCLRHVGRPLPCDKPPRRQDAAATVATAVAWGAAATPVRPQQQ